MLPSASAAVQWREWRTSSSSDCRSQRIWVGTITPQQITKQAQQRLHFLRKLKQASLPTKILRTFYRGVVESVLTYCGSTWYSSCSVSDKKALQRIVRGAEGVIGVSLPSVQELFQSRCRSRALNIVGDPPHPLHKYFELLPSGKRYRSLKSRTTRMINSFLPQAVRLLNCWPFYITLTHYLLLPSI